MCRNNDILRAKAGTTMRTAVDRITRTYELANADQVQAGAGWYDHGNKVVADLARKGRISKDRAAVVIAHLSPQTTWNRNVAGAYGLVTHGVAPHCIQANVKRAQAALTASDPWLTFTPTAPKTKRFARNLLGAVDVVTVDVWALRVALGVGWGAKWRTGDDDHLDRIIGRVGVYEAIEVAYLKAARRLDIKPTEVQATTWIVARNGRTA